MKAIKTNIHRPVKPQVKISKGFLTCPQSHVNPNQRIGQEGSLLVAEPAQEAGGRGPVVEAEVVLLEGAHRLAGELLNLTGGPDSIPIQKVGEKKFFLYFYLRRNQQVNNRYFFPSPASVNPRNFHSSRLVTCLPQICFEI